MGRIHRLSSHEAQKIAAGEVVERPANVVKELIENACDAGATTITLDLEDAGKKLLRITDNGCGMAEDDARLSIEQHTTSKITSVEDLATLTTFGFRGEALASIAAVSRLQLTTKEASMPHALQLTVHTGNVTQETHVAHNTGTTIEVHDLFCNVPVRQKFLKKRDTEWNQINQFLQAFCLSHCSVNLTATHDNKTLVRCPAVTTLRDRFVQLWGPAIAPHLITIESVSHPSRTLSLSGVISDHQHARYDRSGIFFFVNNRWIKNTTLTRALLNAYQNVLPNGRYPMASLFITIDTHEIDVNIHPRKEEVQFLHPRVVEAFIQDIVKQTLENRLSVQVQRPIKLAAGILPDGSIQRMRTYAPSFSGITRQEPTQAVFHPGNSSSIIQTELAQPQQFSIPDAAFVEEQPITVSDVTTNAPLPITSTTEHIGILIGQYALTYLLVERCDGLWLIDQHAAHERILYEQFSHQQTSIATIQLIAPHLVPMARDQVALIAPHLSLLAVHGFGVEVFSDDQLIVRSTPVHAKNVVVDELLRQYVGWLYEYKSYAPEQFATTLHHHMRAQIACKAAVKAGDTLTHHAMESLLEQLASCPNKLTCPHGRPTSWLLPLHDIEKKFKRRT